ncbi:hypothetical protein DMN91_004646 [Ooceraea biroi]|uniref:Uncharacterized protein n=1 Tax=Ooceraea biroi TaxID=2015173 RepID=A0A3L8DRE7_OOCBI|nr:hypothetical protein DMN91_004646 [Ooceraea biroi]
MATWVIEEHPEFRRWQRISVVQFLCDRERGIRGTNERRVRQGLIQGERHSKEPGLYTGYSDVIMNVLGPAGSGRCFELLMMRNWYSLCDMLITYPYYNFSDLKIDWTDDSWIYDKYNDPWVLRKYQLIHHGILRIVRKCIKCGEKMCNCPEI